MMIENEIARKGVCQKEIEASSGVTVSNWACDRTDCPAYGKWYCPFTGW
jgi:hypothetical protein